MNRFLMLIGVLCVVFVAACGTVAHPENNAEEQVDSTRVERGLVVYRENYCGACHTLTAANTRGTFGPIHDEVAGNAAEYIALESYDGEAATVMDYVRESILNPSVFYTPGYESTNHHMPPFTHLPAEDVEAMVYMLVHQPAATQE